MLCACLFRHLESVHPLLERIVRSRMMRARTVLFRVLCHVRRCPYLRGPWRYFQIISTFLPQNSKHASTFSPRPSHQSPRSDLGKVGRVTMDMVDMPAKPRHVGRTAASYDTSVPWLADLLIPLSARRTSKNLTMFACCKHQAGSSLPHS